MFSHNGEFNFWEPMMFKPQIANGLEHETYNDTWKLTHRIFRDSLTTKAADSYVPYQSLENLQLLTGLLDNPLIYRDHIRRYTNSFMTQVELGFRTVDNFDPKLQQLYSGFGMVETDG